MNHGFDLNLTRSCASRKNVGDPFAGNSGTVLPQKRSAERSRLRERSACSCLAMVLSIFAFGCASATRSGSSVTNADFPISITIAGTGNGAVTSNPAGFNCSSDCSAGIPFGSTVTLSATPGPNATFAGWNGDCTGTGSCPISVTSAKSVTATFSAVQFNLAVAVSGSGKGKLESTPAGIDCGDTATTCSALFNAGSSVTLTPVMDAESTFGGWSSGCTGTGVCLVSMSADRSAGVAFNLIRYAIVVTLDSAGSGLVQSQPQGIVCGQACFANFEIGQSVTLTAAPAAGFAFSGWSGDCSGAGTCTITNIATARSVVAHFAVTPGA